jgi:hypothetical protein
MLLGAVVWIPTVHLLFQPRLADYVLPAGLPPMARSLATRYLNVWADPQRRAAEIAKMRATNAEWDFMARTFLVLSLANVGLRDAALRTRCLITMDAILDETLRL